jgi:hypothetical protein
MSRVVRVAAAQLAPIAGFEMRAQVTVARPHSNYPTNGSQSDRVE